MIRPPLTPVPVPLRPGQSLQDLASFAAQVQVALDAISKALVMHASAINQMAEGQGICRGSVTLRDGQTTTTVTDDRIPAGAGILLTPQSGTWTTLTLRASSVAKGTFTITHSNEAATDRVVAWQASVAG